MTKKHQFCDYYTPEPCMQLKLNNGWETKYPEDILECDGYVSREQLAEMLDMHPNALPNSENYTNKNIYDSLMFTKAMLAERLLELDWFRVIEFTSKTEQNTINTRIREICEEILDILYPFSGISYWEYLDEQTQYHGIRLEIRLCGKRFLLLDYRPIITRESVYD